MSDPNDHYYNASDLAKLGEIGKNQPELAKKFFDLLRCGVRRGRVV